MKMYWIKKILKGIVFFLVFATFFSYLVMWLWNMIIPSVTGWTELNFWQAAGLLCLSKILFGFRGGWGRHWGGHPRQNYFWKNKWDDKLSHMTPDERENMKNMWSKHFCNWEEEPKQSTTEKQSGHS